MIALFLLNSAIVALVVIVHYEFLFQLSSLLPKLKLRHRFRIVVVVFGAMVAHAVEIWLFAFCYARSRSCLSFCKFSAYVFYLWLVVAASLVA